jgi:hypothetical protein
MTWGLRSYDPRQAADREPVKRLREAGAIPLGITNVPELMIWLWTATAANGVTRNPRATRAGQPVGRPPAADLLVGSGRRGLPGQREADPLLHHVGVQHLVV